MRIILFFDLPRDNASERATAIKFVKNLIKEGFIMLQESVYCKLALNSKSVDFIKKRVEQLKPKKGNIIMLTITEKQFSSMDYILGEMQDRVEYSADRMVII